MKDIPNIPRVFDRIFVIDNGSNDGTVEYLASQGIEVYRQKTPSYNGAYIDAINHAGDCSLVFFHPKGTIDASSLNIAAQRMREGYDFVIASRIMHGARNEEDHRVLRPRKWFVWLIAVWAKLRWGMQGKFYLDDPLHGYRGTSTNFMKTLHLNSSGVTADIEMIRHAYRGNFRNTAFPVIESERDSGSTHFPAFSTGKNLLKYMLRAK